MNNNILKNSRINFFSLTLAFASVIFLGIFTQSCSKEDEEPLDKAILNSSELEEYIIAGADFHQSLAIFEKELNKIDFSTLEVTYNAEGKKVIHLPDAFVSSIKIEEKVQAFNEKKEALQKKFPQFDSFRKDIGIRYIEQCIDRSANVTGKLLELGYISSRPLLKNGNEQTVTYYGSNEAQYLQGFLYSWLFAPDFVEVYILTFADGSYAVVHNSESNSSGTAGLYYTVKGGGTYTTLPEDNRQIVSIGHTHGYGGNGPNPTLPYYDANGIYHPGDYHDWPGITSRYIYYDGQQHYY